MPVTPDTSFSVASVSKTFTAALILALVEDGRLSLDGSAKGYLPSLPIDPAITVRELLDHTSGLRDFFFGAGVDHALLSQPARVWDPKRSFKYVGKPFSKPGAEWHYSNTNYLVLGMLAEAVGGAPIADQLRDRFFTPLRMDDTYYQVPGEPWPGPVAHGYRFLGADPALPAIDLSDGSAIVPFTSVVTAAGGAGSIASSAGDLARWALALYGGDLLDPATRDAMVADVARTAPLKPGIPYGLGVQAITVDGHPTLGHSGRFLGARAVVRWLPRERIAIAVLTNQSRSDPNVVLASLLKLAFQPPTRLPLLRRRPLTAPGARGNRNRRRPVPAPRPVGTDGSGASRPDGGETGTTSRKGLHGDPCRCLHERGDGERHPRAPWSRSATPLRRAGRSPSTAWRGRASTTRPLPPPAPWPSRATTSSSRSRTTIPGSRSTRRGTTSSSNRARTPWRATSRRMPGFDPGRALTRPSGEFLLLRDVRLSIARTPGGRRSPPATTPWSIATRSIASGRT